MLHQRDFDKRIVIEKERGEKCLDVCRGNVIDGYHGYRYCEFDVVVCFNYIFITDHYIL